MNSLVVLFLVVAIQLNEDEIHYLATPVPKCPSIEQVEAEVSTLAGVKQWGMRCGPVFMGPLSGEGT